MLSYLLEPNDVQLSPRFLPETQQGVFSTGWDILRQAFSDKLMLVANSIFTLVIQRIQAQNERRF